MKNEEIKQKANLSWDLEDYKNLSEEPPGCLNFGKTEGEAMSEEEVEEWMRQMIQCLSILREDHPIKFKEQYSYYLLDLDYLYSLGKINQEDYEKLKTQEIFNFGQE
jgi:predicted RNase H-like HicB family nuclease